MGMQILLKINKDASLEDNNATVFCQGGANMRLVGLKPDAILFY